MKTHTRILIAGLLGCLLTACSGGGSSDGGASVLAEGVFLDSAVEGLRYETNTQDGFTDETGKLIYFAGEMVSFYIGDVLLGSAPGASVLTPVDLVPGANSLVNPVSDDFVTNRLRFLQTLDDDYDPSNGIVISEPVFNTLIGRSVSFNQSITNFQFDDEVVSLVADATGAIGSPRTLIPAITAQAHMRATLEALESPGGDPPDTLGELLITGADAEMIGSPFTPDPGLSFSDIATFSTLEWNESRPAAPGAEAAIRFDIRFSNLQTPLIAEITLTWEQQPGSFISYGVACNGNLNSFFPDGFGCPGVAINLDGGVVEIGSLILSRDKTSGSTLFLSGTLGVP